MRRAAVLATILGTAAALLAPQTSARAQEEDPDGVDREGPEAREMVLRQGGAGPMVGWIQAARRGHLGVSVDDVDREAADSLGLSEVRGARVLEVVDGSPAAEAGIREDDVIVRFNDEAVESVAELVRLVRETPPGREVGVRVIRDGDARDLAVEVGEREGFDRARMERLHERMERLRDRHGEEMEELHRRMEDWDFDVESGGDAVVIRMRRGRMGVRLESLTDQLAEYFGVADRGGALVASVRDDSPAQEAGIRAGDVIVAVGDEETSDPGDVAEAVRDAEAGPLTVTVVRRGQERSVTVELPERDEMSLRSGTPASPRGSGVGRPGAPPAPVPGTRVVPRPPTPEIRALPPVPPLTVPPAGPGAAPLAPGPVPAPPGAPARV
jgi:C-terminal processing protease CtpA/Prc